MSARRTAVKRAGRLSDTNDADIRTGPTSVPAAFHLALLGAGCLLALLGAQAQHAPIRQEPPGPALLTESADSEEGLSAASPGPVLVTKDRPLQPLSFVPPDLVDVAGTRLAAAAAEDYEAMTAAAANDGVFIIAISGFRSYAEQAELHARYQSLFGAGRAADLSAKPGHSEHQSGLAVDIADASGQCPLLECFADTPAGAWSAANGWKFGFIVRYPAGAQSITGYSYEPWHLRHVGKATAAEMHAAGTPTLEENLKRQFR